MIDLNHILLFVAVVSPLILLARIGRLRNPQNHGWRIAALIVLASCGATWLVVHLFYLIGFQNRLIVVIRWFISFITRGRGARLITSTPASDADARPAARGSGVREAMTTEGTTTTEGKTNER